MSKDPTAKHTISTLALFTYCIGLWILTINFAVNY